MARVVRTDYRRITEEVVRSIERPEFTKTWHPFTHSETLDAAEFAIKEIGISVESRQYSLSSDGLNMFFIWKIKRANGKFMCLAGRNSVGKKLSIAYCDLITVIECMNQISKAEFVPLRRHTGTLTFEEMKTMAIGAIKKVVNNFDSLNQWHEELHSFSLTDSRAKDLTIESMRQGVLPPSKFKKFDKLVLLPGAKYEKSLYGFHGGLTELIRDHNFLNNIEENARITQFINSAKEQT